MIERRSEIDGLRAIAIVPVILFHAGFETFNGGFIGVDIFFVISGYLITNIILNNIKNNEYNFFSFLERRARRLLPALLLVSVAILPFAWTIFPPKQLLTFSDSLLSVVSFSSNIFFGGSTTTLIHYLL